MATYSKELDELRAEVRQSVASTLRWWPKIAGTGNVLASATAADNTYIIYDSSNTVVQASANATNTDVGTEYSYLTFSVPAIATLQEDCRVEILWKQRSASVQYRDVLFFDVVLYPFGHPSVSLNDLLEERPDCAELLDRLGVLLGHSTGDSAKNGMAAVLAYRARVELEAKVRDAVASKQGEGGSYSSTDLPSVSDRYTRPRLILNRERLNRVERKLACMLMYAADMTAPEGEDESAALYRHYRLEAETAWKGIGPLRYDTSEDLVPDSTIVEISRVKQLARSW
jgi:hypothetical protein